MVIVTGHRSDLPLSFSAKKHNCTQSKQYKHRPKCDSRKSDGAGEGHGKRAGVDSGDGHIPGTFIGKLSRKDWLRQQCIAFQSSRLCQAVLDMPLAYGNRQAGKYCHSILPCGKGAVLQALTGAAARHDGGMLLPKDDRIPIFSILAVLQQKRDAR